MCKLLQKHFYDRIKASKTAVVNTLTVTASLALIKSWGNMLLHNKYIMYMHVQAI